MKKIENLTGTNGDDRLIGGSNFVLTGRNRGIVDDFFVFNDIENLVGTVGDDNFDFSNGFLDGTVRGALQAGVADADTLIELNYFEWDGDGQGTAAKRDARGDIESVTRFEEIENLVGTLGSDTFNLAGYMYTGRIDGLSDYSGQLAVDRVIIDQDTSGEGLQQNIAIDVTGSESSAVRYGSGSAQFDYAGIEDFQLSIRQDLLISGAGRVSSRSDINVAGSLTLDAAANGDALSLVSTGNMTVDENLLLQGRSIIDVSTEGTVLTIGSGISIDTASGAGINVLVAFNITEEPLIQLQVEETTSLSVFDGIDVYVAGRSSVARTNGVKLESEGDLIEALTGAQ